MYQEFDDEVWTLGINFIDALLDQIHFHQEILQMSYHHHHQILDTSTGGVVSHSTT